MLAINLYIPCNFTLKKGRKLLYFLCLQNLLVFFFIFSLAVSMSLILEEKTVKSWRIILRKYLKDNICIRLNFFFFIVFSSNILMSLLNYSCWPSLDICEEILGSERGEDPSLDICEEIYPRIRLTRGDSLCSEWGLLLPSSHARINRRGTVWIFLREFLDELVTQLWC